MIRRRFHQRHSGKFSFRPRRGQTALVFAFGAALILVASAHAATREDLKKVETQLDERRQQADALDEKAAAANENIRDLQQKLIAATQSLQAKEEEQSRLEDREDDLARGIAAKSKDLNDKKRRLGLLVDALIELARRPPETLFLQSGPAADHVHRAVLLRAILPRLEAETEGITRALAGLAELEAQMAVQKHLVTASRQNLESQQRDLDQLIKTRQGLLQRTEAQKAAINRQLASLSGEARDLRQLLEEVTPKHAPKSGHLPGLRSGLRPPVAGTLTRSFGAKDADGVTSEGLTFAALPGSPVVAPEAGRVVFTGPFRGYGQIVILQNQDGYHSLLAGFGRIDAEVGQEVDAGEPLGVLPVKKGAKPELYFEWRHNNEAVDPTKEIALSKNE